MSTDFSFSSLSWHSERIKCSYLVSKLGKVKEYISQKGGCHLIFSERFYVLKEHMPTSVSSLSDASSSCFASPGDVPASPIDTWEWTIWLQRWRTSQLFTPSSSSLDSTTKTNTTALLRPLINNWNHYKKKSQHTNHSHSSRRRKKCALTGFSWVGVGWTAKNVHRL